MTKKIVIGAVVLSLIFIVIGCSAPAAATVPAQRPAQTPAASTTPAPAVITTPPPPPSSNPKSAGSIKAKWIEPLVNDSAVSIPFNEVKNSWNAVFKISRQGSTLNFMAYALDGELYVRASTCPPCRGITYSLNGDILVCDTCGTTFKAKTGAGIKGACVNYPKAAVQFKIIDGNIVMSETDMVNAYQETLKPG
jgi:nitrite reductase/ring-hydroxylating ferredoxin subunit